MGIFFLKKPAHTAGKKKSRDQRETLPVTKKTTARAPRTGRGSSGSQGAGVAGEAGTVVAAACAIEAIFGVPDGTAGVPGAVVLPVCSDAVATGRVLSGRYATRA